MKQQKTYSDISGKDITGIRWDCHFAASLKIGDHGSPNGNPMLRLEINDMEYYEAQFIANGIKQLVEDAKAKFAQK